MDLSEQHVLSVLDGCCNAFTFPMLDNGYVYLAATRLSLFRSREDWAMTIEVFGFSPRAGLPDTHIYTFGSSLRNRKQPHDFTSRQAYDQHLVNNPHNESRFVYPVEEGESVEAGEWLDAEHVADDAVNIMVRGKSVPLPKRNEYHSQGIELELAEGIHVFELCRWLAGANRMAVLATPEELRVNVPKDLDLILQLDEWNHPNVVDDTCRPSNSETFQQLARVIVSGDVNLYRPTLTPNTHWRNWPEGGTL